MRGNPLRRRLISAAACVTLATPCRGVAQTQADVPAPSGVQAPAQTPLSKAREMLTAEDYAGADAFLRQLIPQQPYSAETHFLFAFTLLHERQSKESLEEYERGAKLRAWSAAEWAGVASDHILLKNDTAAEDALLNATKLAPLRPALWYMLGHLHYAENHFADAEKSLLTCLSLNPQQARAEYTLGLTYEALQHPDKAAAAYRAAIAMQEASATKEAAPYLSLGILLRRQGKAAEALPFLTTAAQLAPASSLAHQEQALAQEQLGQYDQALAVMKTAATLDPKLAELHFFLGRLYRRTGHPEQASSEFAEAAKQAAPKASP